MQKRGFTLVELIAVIVVLAVIILLAVSTFKNVGDRVKKEAYENKVNLIKTKASEYASGTKILVTNVDRLVKKGYISADNENGDVINPVDGSRMNCKIITMYKSEGNYYADYVEDESKEECDASKIRYDNGYTSIDKYLYVNGPSGKKEKGELIEGEGWVREDNLLELKVNAEEDLIEKADIEMIKWETNTGSQEKTGNGEEVENNKFLYSITNSIVDTTVTATVYLKPKSSENEEASEEKNDRTFTATTWVKIDKKRPWVDQKVEIERPNEWTNYGKEVRITAGDEGSGVKGYAVIEKEEWEQLPGNNKCEHVSYEEREENAYTTRLENGKYYVCVKDKAGNVSEDMKEPLFEIDKADATPPDCRINLPEATGKDGWYTEDILFEFLEDAEGKESIKGSGIDTSQIFVDGKLYNETSYVLDEDRERFVVSMNVTDKAGNICHKEVEVKRDATAPTCEYSGESTTWTNSNRTISLGCDDNLSGCAMSYNWNKTYSSTVAEAEFGSYTIEDRAGNTTVCSRNVDAYVDKNAPSCKIDVNGTMGSNSWYTSDVTFKFDDGSDYEDTYESGVKTKTIKVNGVEQTSDSYTLNYDASSLKVSISVTDNAGNTCSKEETIKRDAVTPSASTKSSSISIDTKGTNWNYEFKNNINASYGISGGSIVCNPARGSSAHTSPISCYALGNNGLRSSNVSFSVTYYYSGTREEIAATKDTKNKVSSCADYSRTERVCQGEQKPCCSSGECVNGSNCNCTNGTGSCSPCSTCCDGGSKDVHYCPSGYKEGVSGCSKCGKKVCPKGYTSESDTTCYKYTCPAGYTLSGSTCYRYTCPSGGTVRGSTCYYN